jgi:cytidylate kinase
LNLICGNQSKSDRPPWYDEHGALAPFVIGVAGGTASGKTTVCNKILEKLNIQWVLAFFCICLSLLARAATLLTVRFAQKVSILPVDSFYRPLTQDEIADVANYNL